jgi:AraC-like DNA-binding protein
MNTTVVTKRSEVKEQIKASLGTLLSEINTADVTLKTDFGQFSCSIETFDHFGMLRRNFETAGESLHIPFSNSEHVVSMIFSLDGHSFFNDRYNPLNMRPSSQSLNFFKEYQCTNLLDDHAHQHDYSIFLRKSFYMDLISQYLESAEDRIPMMIAQQQEFNTINDHIPSDAAVTGILTSMMQCPFQNEMREIFLREHIRALFIIQLYHFNQVVTGRPLRIDTHLSTADREKLQSVKEYIDKNFLNPASLESLTRDFGLNEFKLKSGFKTMFDTSPIKYLQGKRLTFALSLLRDTNKSIKEISYEIGYSHAANFTNAFVKKFGKAPERYRVNTEARELRGM